MQCPKCGTELAAGDADIGRQGKCATCGTLFTIAPPVAGVAVPADPPLVAQPAVPLVAEVPGKVQAVAILTIIGGIVAILITAAYVVSCVGMLWLPWIYSLVLGILALARGVKIVNGTRPVPSPKTVAIMQIINIINADVINLVLGIVTLVLLSDEEVARYFGGA
jgi:hypothetical protein